MSLSFVVESEIKKFLCIGCGARFEEEMYDEVLQECFCIQCGSVNIMPFRESAKGQVGCSAKGCGRRIVQDGKEVVGCGSGGCGSCGGGCG